MKFLKGFELVWDDTVINVGGWFFGGGLLASCLGGGGKRGHLCQGVLVSLWEVVSVE